MNAATNSTLAPLLITVPHAGEQVPECCPWLNNLPEPVLMSDVDRYVDALYAPAVEKLGLAFVKTPWHRYAADLNRFPTDVDADAVEGSANKSGLFTRGFHWVKTFEGAPLMRRPMSKEVHEQLVKLIYDPFHAAVASAVDGLRGKTPSGVVFHVDAHSVPSVGTSEHRDPGERRADIVVSDVQGKSARPEFVDLVISSYARAGFKVAHNWPYLGGRMTERYGQPGQGHHTVQVELNRGLYMDEVAKKIKTDAANIVSTKIERALARIQSELPRLL